MEESTTYQVILGRGIEKGALREMHKTLRRLGEKRFGTPSPDLSDRLDAIQDLERLERMAGAVLDAPNWNAVLDTP